MRQFGGIGNAHLAIPLTDGTMRVLLPLLAILVVFGSCSKQSHEGPVVRIDQGLAEDLKAIEGKRIYFGHQSVGKNIMDGVKDLLSAVPQVHINLVMYNRGFMEKAPFFAHSKIGENREPTAKCEAFKSVLSTLDSVSPVDIALMKFCFVDFTPETNVRELFDYYQTVIDSLKARSPHTVFVHVTSPLERRTGFLERTIRAIIGREDYLDLVLLKINEFNALLRDHYRSEPVFDLAAIESTYPDGQREVAEIGGTPSFTLIPEYTSDGGHLNDRGRMIAARQLVHTLSLAAKKEPSSKVERN